MDDAALLAAASHGDAEAFAVFYRRHLPLVVAFALRATGDRELAADIAGEVFAAALVGSRRYEPHRDSAAPWLLGIANNKLRESRRRGRVEDAMRRRLRVAALPFEDDDLRRVDELAAAGTVGVLAAVEELPAREREAVRARVIDEREYASIASELRCSELVVRKRVSRGLARLRARVGERGEAIERETGS